MKCNKCWRPVTGFATECAHCRIMRKRTKKYKSEKLVCCNNAGISDSPPASTGDVAK